MKFARRTEGQEDRLLDFDLTWIAGLLLPPPRQPDYRRGRGHLDFLTRLEVTRTDLQSALQQAWNAGPAIVEPDKTILARLMAEKYSRDDWNLKW